MDYKKAQMALVVAEKCDKNGRYAEADFLTNEIIRVAQADENLAGKLGNAISNGGYQIQNWGANVFKGGGENSQRVVDQIDYFLNQMQSNRFLRDPNQKNALISALQEAKQIAYSLSTGYTNQQEQAQQRKESDLAAQYLFPKAASVSNCIRTADDRSIPVVINDISNLINFARQAYGNRDQQQVSQLIEALNKAKSVMRAVAGYYTPAPTNYPQMDALGEQPAQLEPTHLNTQQQEFLDKYMKIGIASGRDKMIAQMNANPYHTAPFKSMVINFWDEQVGPKLAQRKQMMQSAPSSAT